MNSWFLAHSLVTVLTGLSCTTFIDDNVFTSIVKKLWKPLNLQWKVHEKAYRTFFSPIVLVGRGA